MTTVPREKKESREREEKERRENEEKQERAKQKREKQRKATEDSALHILSQRKKIENNHFLHELKVIFSL